MHYSKLMLEETLLLTQRIDYNSSGYEQYIGYAPVGSDETHESWVIHELIYDSSNRMSKKLFAEASKSFDKAWSERGSYEYA